MRMPQTGNWKLTAAVIGKKTIEVAPKKCSMSSYKKTKRTLDHRRMDKRTCFLWRALVLIAVRTPQTFGSFSRTGWEAILEAIFLMRLSEGSTGDLSPTGGFTEAHEASGLGLEPDWLPLCSSSAIDKEEGRSCSEKRKSGAHCH